MDVRDANILVHSRMAAQYNEREPHFRPENRATVRARLQALRTEFGGRLLDIGCGTGFIIDIAADLFDDVKGIDLTPAMLERVQQRPNVQVFCGDAAAVPFGTATGTPGEIVFADPGAIAGRVTAGTSLLRLGATTIDGATLRAGPVVVNEAITYNTGTLEITSGGTLAFGTDGGAPAFAVTAAQMGLLAAGAIGQANGTLAISGDSPAANLLEATVDAAAGAGGREAAPVRLHDSVTYGVLGMDAYAFGNGAGALA